MSRLEGKVAIITGASRGIGLAIAQRFADEGARVALVSRKHDALEVEAAKIRERGGQALAIAAHAGKDDAVAAMVDRVVERWGGVDVLVNNAGTNPHFGPLLSADSRAWAKTMEVNLEGYLRTIRACVPVMKRGGGGRIVNIASVAGLRPQPGMGVYGISKAGVVMMTKILAVELAGDGIAVNVICPGFVRTKLSAALWSDETLSQRIVSAIPAGRIADASEIAGPALFLVSSDASFTTGAVLEVDGGQLSASGIQV